MIPSELLAYPEKPSAVVPEEPFCFAAVGLAHGHIYGMCAGLIAAGATLSYVYDDDPALVDAFRKRFPGIPVAKSYDVILSDPRVKLIACADIPSMRAGRGVCAMRADKDFFVDKAPFISLEQAEEIRKTVGETGRRYAVYYSERVASESAVYAEMLIKRGVIGRVTSVVGLGPHKLNNGERRGDWFYARETQGGILIDIGSHQIEQFLALTGNRDAVIDSAHIANFAHKAHPGFDDFGDCTLHGENGAAGHFRVDWFTPGGVRPFGDTRTFIEGTKGYIELRKNTDIGASDASEHIIIATDDGVEKRCVEGKIGIPFFSALIRDCLDRTETALPFDRALTAGILAVKAQNTAIDLER